MVIIIFMDFIHLVHKHDFITHFITNINFIIFVDFTHLIHKGDYIIHFMDFNTTHTNSVSAARDDKMNFITIAI